MNIIVVNYRREDVPAEARQIRDSLVGQTGRTDVVMFDERPSLVSQLGIGDVLIAVIGPRWLELTRGHAARGERDDVRAQIATALRRGLAVIPVRVGYTAAVPAMPRAEDLPDDIRALAQYKSRTIAIESFENDAMALRTTIRPTTVVTAHERLPGNSNFKMLLMATAAIASTILFANFVAYLTSPTGRAAFTQPGAEVRPTTLLQGWTGEGRIRRAIEAALAKGRRPEEARRCQSALITATDGGSIVFTTASAELDLRSHQTLDALAEIIKDCPDFIIEVDGHTDSAGDPGANQRLSERRATAVRDYLVRAGVAGGSLSAAGYGETRPLAPNDTPANMARNRRIEFNIAAR